MDEPRWLWRAIVDAVHRELVEEHGGLYGVRDAGMIESALARPLNRWSYEGAGADLADLAAAYGFALARNHGYLDGNKRIALAAMHVFAWINGHEIAAEEPDEVATMLDVASGVLGEADLAAWLRVRLSPRDPSEQ
ncbi:MAG TPA: type II toxin-antitoxin system death-on-curing family toxin [Longimicrobium sp.]|nr:type II toxin-antitoxin system death-on-curing family toxin [Longimicrobium sp.]